jgi:hypothetical protein
VRDCTREMEVVVHVVQVARVQDSLLGWWEEDADVSLRSGDGWRKGLIEGPALGNPTRHGPESRARESG